MFPARMMNTSTTLPCEAFSQRRVEPVGTARGMWGTLTRRGYVRGLRGATDGSYSHLQT